jgi:hypothetical protein
MAAVAVVAALAVGAVARPLRPFILVGLAFAYIASGRRGTRSEALAAGLPLAAILAWSAIAQPVAAAGAAQCTDLFAPPAVWRLLEALVGIAVLAIVVVERRTTLAELGVRLGSRPIAALALIGAIVVGPVALNASTWLGGDVLGGSFFGTYQLDLSRPLALLPAVVFAVSNPRPRSWRTVAP